MKTIVRIISKLGRYRTTAYFGKMTFALTLMAVCASSQAQNANKTITISGSKFASPLIEKWAGEYSKANPDVTIKFVKNNDPAGVSDLMLTVNSSSESEGNLPAKQVNVGRLAVLPVTNERNRIFDKQLKNGVKQEELKNIFLGIEDNSFDSEQKPATGPLYTLYTQPPQAATAKVLIDHFGPSASELGGILVTGDDKYLIESVLSDSTGVTYGKLSLIYDLKNREPLKGIKILPIDPDNSGRLKKEELVYNNLDQLISFLESSPIKTIPSDNICFSFNKKNSNPQVEDFVNWVKISGQEFNHQYGFLKTNDDPSLTQK